MGCYLCQNDYGNVHTRAFICTLQYACQHSYARYNMHATCIMHIYSIMLHAWDVNNYDLRQHNYTLKPNNMHMHVHIIMIGRLVGTHNINYG